MTAWYNETAKTVNNDAEKKAAERQLQLTKPPGSLGMLESVATKLAALQGREKPSADNALITIFAGDHGVVEEGVSAFPQVVTGEMVKNFARGGAAITVMARKLDAKFQVINTGTVNELEALDHVKDCRIAGGTANFAQKEAMTQDQLEKALQVGADVIDTSLKDKELDIFIAGEMGIGNTTSASAITSWLLKESPESSVGPGTGVDSTGVNKKAEVVKQALNLHKDAIIDGLSLLRCVGGFEIVAMAGAYIRAAQLGVPCLVDGFISTAAASCAASINPSVKPWLIISHQSAEPAHIKLIEALGQKPLLQLDMRLGEGSGAAVALPLIRSACALHNEMATFADAGVSEA